MALTEEQKKAYLDSGGSRCPYCGNDDIEGDLWDSDTGYTTQRIVCHACDAAWRDIYSLSNVDDDVE